ncbi:MAG TPA: tripartite tricarboxylate transporter substrate binding protein [Thermodesulfobacteriota bacterium]|nr:tripartite tricarboxylate transporter substrate binding protein [Thermodesulfobacteriota bacterium]
MRKAIFATIFVVNMVFVSILVNPAADRAWGADKYPSRSIELMTPDPPGAYSDLINRVLAKKLEKVLGVLVVPVNKPGGGDLVAATALANAAPDGYTLGLLADGPLVYSHMLGRATFSKDDIRAVGQLICTTIIMQVSADSPWKTFQEFMDYAQKNPGLTYGHMGIGSATWARAEYLNKVGNLKMRGIPFSGTNEVITALLGKHVSAGFGNYVQAKQQADGGKTRILFSFTPPGQGPDSALPTIPSVFGKDVPDIPPPSNHLAAPGKTPEEIIKILEGALEKVSKDPEFLNDMKKLYANVCLLDSKTTKIRHEEKALQLTPIFQRAGLMK